MTSSADRPSRSSRPKPFQPAIGIEIEIDDVPAIEAKTRGFLARFIAISVAIAIAVTGSYGLVT
jgi:hypothetical protein